MIRRKELEQRGTILRLNKIGKNKNDIIWTALHLRREAKLDKMRELEERARHSVRKRKVKNISLTRREDT